jgi:hypothetical protein
MKKLIILFGFFVLVLSMPTTVDAKPIWIKFKLGLFAKWGISLTGDCKDGWGLCLAFTDNPVTNTFLGYDEETDKFSIKISKMFSQAKEFSLGKYEIKENSPIDPKLISRFSNYKSPGKKVIIKKGIYQIYEEGDYYIMGVDYFLE